MSFGTYWLVAVPGENSKDATFGKVSSAVAEFAKASRFHVPDQLKVGTLDSLMSLSDEMNKTDQFSESVCTKAAQALNNLIEKDKEHLESQLLANSVELNKYIETFQWNEAKFPVRSGVRELVELAQKQIASIDTELKTKMASFQASKTNLANLDRKQTGNLLVRALAELVKKENFVADSEYLMTALVVVPKQLTKEFLAQYETLTAYVVPRSAEKISEDNEFVLYGVTLFKRIYSDFKTAAREKKFVVRDFHFDEAEITKERSERENLGQDVKKQTTTLIRWLKTTFSEAFIAWMHVKALRTFVESVLRFGLPINFVALTILTSKKNEKKTRQVLDATFVHLAGRGGTDTMDDPSLISSGHAEFYPYVFFPIVLDFIK